MHVYIYKYTVYYKFLNNDHGFHLPELQSKSETGFLLVVISKVYQTCLYFLFVFIYS